MLHMPFNAQTSALTFIKGKPSTPSTDTWQNTGEPPHWDRTQHLNLKKKGPSFEDSNVHVLDKEDRGFERGVKEPIYVHLEKPL